MKLFFLFVILIIVDGSHVFSQSNPLDKKIDKIYSLVEKSKYKEADEQLEKLLEENPEFGNGWDYLAKLRYKEYKDLKATDGIFSGKISVTTTDKNNKTIENDSLVNTLRELLNKHSPSKVAYSKYIYTLRKALLSSTDAYNSSSTLRSLYIDAETDTAVSKKALKYFNDAELEFSKKNYENAAKLYKRAVEEQPDFFKASLYLGDCFYFTKNYVNSTLAFKSAVNTFPNLLEPRKYLIDSYSKEQLYEACLEECIKAMTVYPDITVMEKMEDAAYYLGKKIDIKWTPRLVFPNQLVDTSEVDVNEYKPEKVSAVKEPWTFYKKAMENIKTLCNQKGIMGDANKITNAIYLEVYSWQEMLKNSNDVSLDQARKMEKEGYLDCYVLVTCFHFDIYEQYADFVSKRKEKVIEYYKKYIIKK